MRVPESTNIPVWLIQSGFSLGGVLVGAGITWGMLRERIGNLVRAHEELKISHVELSKRVDILDRTALQSFVLDVDCKACRAECQNNMCRVLKEIKEEITRNQAVTTLQFKQISETLGYFKGRMEREERE